VREKKDATLLKEDREPSPSLSRGVLGKEGGRKGKKRAMRGGRDGGREGGIREEAD